DAPQVFRIVSAYGLFNPLNTEVTKHRCHRDRFLERPTLVRVAKEPKSITEDAASSCKVLLIRFATEAELDLGGVKPKVEAPLRRFTDIARTEARAIDRNFVQGVIAEKCRECDATLLRCSNPEG